jgi:hypothetical protein
MPQRMTPGGDRRKPYDLAGRVARRHDERLASEGHRRIDTGGRGLPAAPICDVNDIISH